MHGPGARLHRIGTYFGDRRRSDRQGVRSPTTPPRRGPRKARPAKLLCAEPFELREWIDQATADGRTARPTAGFGRRSTRTRPRGPTAATRAYRPPGRTAPTRPGHGHRHGAPTRALLPLIVTALLWHGLGRAVEEGRDEGHEAQSRDPRRAAAHGPPLHPPRPRDERRLQPHPWNPHPAELLTERATLPPAGID